LLKGEKLGGTRSESSAEKKAVTAKAKPAPVPVPKKAPPKLTKTRTMTETAKEGKEFVKAANKRKAAKK